MAAPSDALGALAEPVALVPEPEPPARDLTPRQWVRLNLLSSPLNVVLTVAFGVVAAWAIFRLARWVFVTADWTIVRVFLRLFMVGLFPADQLWRLWVSGYVLAATLGLAAGALAATSARVSAEPSVDGVEGANGVGRGAAAATAAGSRDARAGWPRRAAAALHRFWPAALGVAVMLSFTRTPLPAVLTVGLVAVLVTSIVLGGRLPTRLRRWVWVAVVVGVVASLQVVTAGADGVGWDDWGGLHLAVAATVAGIALAFPLGLVLALGRRSSMPGMRVLSTGYIEMFRAVPLVTLLFVGQYMVGFLFPTSVDPPSFLVRAVIAITLFEAAYIAEIVRGGLQAVPVGQVEAAQAVGLSPPKVLRLVVLPQALRAVIPAMVGQFISLFKDTSLLSIIGFIELIGVADFATDQPRFQGEGLRPLAFAFIGFLFWAVCSTMSRESQRLERRLGVGER
ncbi:MAG: amino acid ABC transporter permease [Acidimicrobiales bacterium]